MRRRKRKKIRIGRIIFLFSLLLCFVIGVCFFGIKKLSTNNKNDNNKRIVNKEKKEDKVQKISLVMVGDNLIHDKIYLDAKEGNGYDFKKMYSVIKPIVQEYDLAYYNQETILGGSEIGLSSYPAFNSPYEVGDALIDAGFNLVSLATNHTMDRGEKAILNSRNYWNQFEDVLAVGSYSSFEERDKVIIKEVNGVKYTMLNYTYGLNGISIPQGKEYLVNVWPVSGSRPDNDSKYQNYKEEVKKDIEKVRDKVDVLLVAMHWGIEYEFDPNLYQKDMASYLSGLGVDVIIGTHPHVIQPIEWIGDTLVIYSLGNFISAHEVINMGNRVGLMSSIDIIKDKNGIKIQNLKNDLLYTYYKVGYHDFLVVPFSNHKIGDYLDDYKSVYDKYSAIVKKIDSNIEVVPCE